MINNTLKLKFRRCGIYSAVLSAMVTIGFVFFLANATAPLSSDPIKNLFMVGWAMIPTSILFHLFGKDFSIFTGSNVDQGGFSVFNLCIMVVINSVAAYLIAYLMLSGIYCLIRLASSFFREIKSK